VTNLDIVREKPSRKLTKRQNTSSLGSFTRLTQNSFIDELAENLDTSLQLNVPNKDSTKSAKDSKVSDNVRFFISEEEDSDFESCESFTDHLKSPVSNIPGIGW
jgi:hypothetical protein